MTFDIHLHFDSQSPEGHILEAIVSRERQSPEDAIRFLLKRFDQADPDNCDHLFTPEAVADLRNIAVDMEAGGKSYSSDEIRQHFVQKRES